MEIVYNGRAMSNINLYSKIDTKKKISKHRTIQINCLNASFSKEKNDISLEY